MPCITVSGLNGLAMFLSKTSLKRSDIQDVPKTLEDLRTREPLGGKFTELSKLLLET